MLNITYIHKFWKVSNQNCCKSQPEFFYPLEIANIDGSYKSKLSFSQISQYLLIKETSLNLFGTCEQ